MICACRDLSSAAGPDPFRAGAVGCGRVAGAGVETFGLVTGAGNLEDSPSFSCGVSGVVGSSSSGTGGESVAFRLEDVGSIVSVRGGGLPTVESLEPPIDARGCFDDGLAVPVFIGPPPIDSLLVWAFVLLVVLGGPILGRPAILSLDFALESEVRAVVAGVPVRGVDVPELLEGGGGLVGDFVGD